MQETYVVAEASVGSSPGLEYDDIVKLPDGPAPVCVTCTDYGPGQVQLQEIKDSAFNAKAHACAPATPAF